MAQLKNRMRELIQACFTGIWLRSHEMTEAVSDLSHLCRDEQWQLMTWDIEQGLASSSGVAVSEAVDPLAAIRALGAMAGGSTDTSTATTVLVLKNFHRFLNSPEIIQAMCRAIIEGKMNRTFIVVLAPVVQLPPELERLFIVVEHDLPTKEELQTLLESIATEPGEMPPEQSLNAVLDATAGLTRYEAENAYSLSLVRHQNVRADAIWELKTQALKKSGLLSLSRSQSNFSSLGGLTALKAFSKRALLRASCVSAKAKPKGVLLLSPPGCGKSAFCKSLGNEVGRPVVTLDVGSLMGSLVGQSEERTRDALRIVDSMAPCVLMIEEVDKALSGVGGQSGDSGVSSRMFGTLLTWLNDHESDVFVVCSANDITKLPPEFTRAERFDAVFFLDLPDRVQKDAIWDMYRSLFEINAEEVIPKDDDWTGAEIRSCCRLASLLDVSLSQASQNVVPVAVTSAEGVQRLRQWAAGRCLDAELGGVYRAEPAVVAPDSITSSSATQSRRRVSRRNPELN